MRCTLRLFPFPYSTLPVLRGEPREELEPLLSRELERCRLSPCGTEARLPEGLLPALHTASRRGFIVGGDAIRLFRGWRGLPATGRDAQRPLVSLDGTRRCDEILLGATARGEGFVGPALPRGGASSRLRRRLRVSGPIVWTRGSGGRAAADPLRCCPAAVPVNERPLGRLCGAGG